MGRGYPFENTTEEERAAWRRAEDRFLGIGIGYGDDVYSDEGQQLGPVAKVHQAYPTCHSKEGGNVTWVKPHVLHNFAHSCRDDMSCNARACPQPLSEHTSCFKEKV